MKTHELKTKPAHLDIKPRVRLEINCRGCKRVLKADYKLGEDTAPILRAYGWTRLLSGYLCASCAAKQRQTA